MASNLSVAIDKVVLAIALKLKIEECPHGMPYRVTVKGETHPDAIDMTFRPLCDACVMAAVRQVLTIALLPVEKCFEEKQDARTT